MTTGTQAAEPARRGLPRPGTGVLAVGQVVVAAVLLGVSRAQWLRVSAAGAAGSLNISGLGTQVAPLVQACAILLAAAAVAAALARRIGSVLALAVAVLACLGATLSAVRLALDPGPAAARQVEAATGVAQAAAASATVWPWVAAAVAAIGACWTVLGFRTPRRRASSRFEQPAPATATTPPEDPAAAWDALTRGEDPTGAQPSDQ